MSIRIYKAFRLKKKSELLSVCYDTRRTGVANVRKVIKGLITARASQTATPSKNPSTHDNWYAAIRSADHYVRQAYAASQTGSIYSFDDNFDVSIYWDIWPDVCTTNLAEITKLKRRYARRVNPGGRQLAWVEGLLRRQLARDKKPRRFNW